MYALLGKPGYEDRKAELEARLSSFSPPPGLPRGPATGGTAHLRRKAELEARL